jgi:branched-chain amino acid transport system permease protein
VIAFIQALIDGVLVGRVYGVIAVGLSLVFGVLGIVNFAQAEFMMMGMYAAWFAWRYLGLDPLIGAVFSFLVGFGIGALAQRFLIQRVMNAPACNVTDFPHSRHSDRDGKCRTAAVRRGFPHRADPYRTQSLQLGPFFVSVPYLAAFGMALVVSVALWLVMARTWIGQSHPRHRADAMAAESSASMPSASIWSRSGSALASPRSAAASFSPIHR